MTKSNELFPDEPAKQRKPQASALREQLEEQAKRNREWAEAQVRKREKNG